MLPPQEARRNVGVAFNKTREIASPYNEIPIAKPGGGEPYFLDSYDPIKREIVFRRETQFSEIQFKSAKAYFREFVTKYPPKSIIADVPSAKELAGQRLGRKTDLRGAPSMEGHTQIGLGSSHAPQHLDSRYQWTNLKPTFAIARNGRGSATIPSSDFRSGSPRGTRAENCIRR